MKKTTKKPRTSKSNAIAVAVLIVIFLVAVCLDYAKTRTWNTQLLFLFPLPLLVLLFLYELHKLRKAKRVERIIEKAKIRELMQTVDGRKMQPFPEFLLSIERYLEEFTDRVPYAPEKYFPFEQAEHVRMLLLDFIDFLQTDVRTYKEVQEKLDALTLAVDEIQKSVKPGDYVFSNVQFYFRWYIQDILSHFNIDINYNPYNKPS
jgi:hypothetical protein